MSTPEAPEAPGIPRSPGIPDYPKLYKCDCGGTIEITSQREADRVVRDQCPFCGVVGSYEVQA